MRILFIHQNFPGQFKHLASSLAQLGHEVHALRRELPDAAALWQGVQMRYYTLARGSSPQIHPWLIDLESKTIRAEAVFAALSLMCESGYTPDLVIAHPGWGESLFVKQVWPQTKLAIYAEFYYHPSGQDIGFDSEFTHSDLALACRLQFKNLHLDMQAASADAAWSPTHWQASTFPAPLRDKIQVMHDGIDTDYLQPDAAASFALPDGRCLSRADEVITFVNRNCEPYRGYHIFMRALPQILANRPQAEVLIVGGDQVSYGAKAPDGKSWLQIFAEELAPQMPQQALDRVHFLGKLPYEAYRRILQISRLHVYLTYPFVLSWSLLEAMSVGCTILASDTAPLREVIQHDENGRLFPFFAVDQLAAQACDLLENPAESQRLGQNARLFAQQHYDLQTICLPQQLAWIENIQ